MNSEQPYIDLVSKILKNGHIMEGRNGNTKSIFGAMMEFSLDNNTMPLLTTKQVFWRTCFKELCWFIKGSTNNDDLVKQNVKIWNNNASKEYLKTRNLDHYQENDLGPIYGHQWRHFNAPYKSCNDIYKDQGIDQLQSIINMLKDPVLRSSRRIVLSSWNPCQLDEMVLPPCHILVQFHVRDNKYLSSCLYQRSGDVGLGVPFNIASYSFLTHLLAFHCDLTAEKFTHFLGDAHIYEDHIPALTEQITRVPYEFPKISFKEKKPKIEDYDYNDIIWEKEYKYHDSIKMIMIV